MHGERRADKRDGALLAEAGAALFRLGRAFGRALPGGQPTDRTGRPVERSRIQVVQAVIAHDDDPARGAASVGTVADALGIDPSTASRLVAETIRDGYLSRTAAPADARRARLALTPAGRDLAGGARAYQRAIFERLTRDWPADERDRFATAFVAFAAGVATLLTEDDRPPDEG